MNGPTLIFDYDSTFSRLEGLDELAAMRFMGDPDFSDKMTHFREITDLGMNGGNDFANSLQCRLDALGKIHRVYVDQTAQYMSLHHNISPSMLVYRDLIARHAQHIFIISGGFHELIDPVAEFFGINPKTNVFANRFKLDEQKRFVVTIDRENLLAHNNGKVKKAQELRDAGRFTSPVIAIGDGMTDFQLLEAGIADFFMAYTETKRRPSVIERIQNRPDCFEAENFEDVAEFVNWELVPFAPEGQPIPSLEISYPLVGTPMQQRK